MRLVRVLLNECNGYEYIKAFTREPSSALEIASTANEIEKAFDHLWRKPIREDLPLEEPEFINEQFEQIYSITGPTLQNGIITVEIETSPGSGTFEQVAKTEINTLFRPQSKMCWKEDLFLLDVDSILGRSGNYKNCLVSRREINNLSAVAQFEIEDDEDFKISSLYFATVDTEHGPYDYSLSLLYKFLYLDDCELKEIWREDSPDVDDWWGDDPDCNEMLINHKFILDQEQKKIFMQKHAIEITCTATEWRSCDFDELYFSTRDIAI